MLPAAERSEANKMPSEARLIGFRHFQCNQSTKQPQCPSGGPVITLTSRPEGPSLMGWDGWDEWDGDLFCPFIFFILCGFIDKINTYIYMYLKIAANIRMDFKI